MAKFKDIPQLTQTTGSPTFVSLNYLDTHITNEIKELNLQLCPDFQRGHVWTETQQIAYVEYLLRGGRSGREFYFNNPGWRTCADGEYVCVDGLQRITALLKFLHDELKVFGHHYSEYEDSRILSVRNGIYWNVNDLQTRKEVLTWYLEMNEGGTPHTKEELDRVRKMIGDEK